MPYVMNALEEPVAVQVHGNWISFHPGQIKLIHNDKIAFKMISDLGYKGLVGIDEAVMEDKNSPESKQALETARRTGIANRMKKLKEIWDNLDVSLRRDLAQMNITGDVYNYASTGELAALKEMNRYKKYEAAADVDRAEQIRKLKEELNGDIASPDAGKAPQGNTNPSGPAKSGK